MILSIASLTVIAILLWWTNSRPTSKKGVGLNILPSDYRFSVYKQPKSSPHKSSFILEGDKIDELGYEIYKSFTADLDRIDILIRVNQTGEIWKIVKDSDSESAIGVSHPRKGHIGYLQFETLKNPL